MSTRCNIVVQDAHSKLWFYRHSDGYPEGALPLLKKFLTWIAQGRIRDNVGQSSGWLIVLGHEEYSDHEIGTYEPGVAGSIGDWKVGSIEPTNGEHGDIEWLYTIDLVKKEIRYHSLYDDGKKIKTWKPKAKTKVRIPA